MSDPIRSLTPLQFVTELHAREAEYRDWLKTKIRQTHKAYLSYAKSELSKVRPIRNPNGIWTADIGRHTAEWYWSDALWCGDISLLWPEEFMSATGQDLDNEGRIAENWAYDDEEQQYANRIFDEVFREVMPKKYHHVLEG